MRDPVQVSALDASDQIERIRNLTIIPSEGASGGTAGPAKKARGATSPHTLLNLILGTLEDAKAEDVVTIDLDGKSPVGDFIVVASGRSNRHVGAIADQMARVLKDNGYGRANVEGLPHCDWVLIDTGEVIVHVFRPEVREFYNLEKMWLTAPPEAGHEAGERLTVS